MAGERIGKTYEAILKIALDQLQNKGTLKGSVFWNETPKGITVEPDFLVGRDKDHPQIIIMVTHSGASGNSHMKCWRNIGELCEIKTSLHPSPIAINVFFESVMKEQLKELQGTAFDAQLIVDTKPYGPFIKNWVHTNESELSIDQATKALEIESQCIANTALGNSIKQLAADIEYTIMEAQTKVNDLWVYEANRTKRQPPKAKETYIRRGLSKLLIFEDLDIALRLYRGNLVKQSELPTYIYDIGLARKGIGRAIPNDYEIQNVVDLLSDAVIRNLIQNVTDSHVIQQYLNQLRNEEDINRMTKYVIKNYDLLCDKEKLFSQLTELHDDPNALIHNDALKWTPSNNWLFEIIIEIIKLSTGKANGYGYAQLSTDVAMPNGVAKDYPKETREFLLSPWGYLSDWITRSERTAIPLDVIRCVSAVLADKLKHIGIEHIMDLSSQIRESYIHNLVEAKLCTYREFSPLALLMEEAGILNLNKDVVKYKTCFAEKAKLNGTAGQTTVVQKENTIINWQSSFGGHPADKKKELSGRAVGLRYTWNEELGKFIPRPKVKKLVLLLDGTWQQQHVDALINAGWDEIYYPDEIEKLKAAIV